MPVKTYAAPSGSFNHFSAIAAGYSDRIGKVVRAAAFNINERAQASFREPKTGRLYGAHRASAPGQAPAIQFGTLAASYRVIPIDHFHAAVASSDEKAPYLEFGTRHMEPRPHLGPAAALERDAFEGAVAAVLKTPR